MPATMFLLNPNREVGVEQEAKCSVDREQVRRDATVFQWLIERGQPEGEQRPIWLEHSAAHPARDRAWTTDANTAAMFPTREIAERYIAEHELAARAVEHGFMQ